MIKFKGKSREDKIPNGIWMASTNTTMIWLVVGDKAYPLEKGVFDKINSDGNFGWHISYWIKISIKSYYENCS